MMTYVDLQVPTYPIYNINIISKGLHNVFIEQGHTTNNFLNNENIFTKLFTYTRRYCLMQNVGDGDPQYFDKMASVILKGSWLLSF